MAYVKHKPCNITGKSPTDVSSGDTVRTSPTIVGVMEKMVPKYDGTKEDLSSAQVEPAITTKLDLEIQKTSDECTANEKEATQKTSYMKAAMEDVTGNTDTNAIADLKKNSEKVNELIPLSDISKVTDDVQKETTRNSELVNITEDMCKMKADEAMTQERLVHREVKEFKSFISDDGPIKEIMKLEVSKTSKVADHLTAMSEEDLVDVKIEVSESLPSDNEPDKNIIKDEKSKAEDVICDINATFLKELEDVQIQGPKLLTTVENSGSGNLKESKTANILKDMPEEKSENINIWESIANISDEKLDSDILRDTTEMFIGEIRRDLDDILEEEVKSPVTVQTSPKVREIQSETKPIVTTPTLSRRGLGGSQRLSRDQRPPPLDVSHLMLSSEEGTDEDFDTAVYIVTEPGDEDRPQQQFQEESIYRINSSPDILAESSLQKNPNRWIPTVQVTEDVRDTLLSEVSMQANEGIPSNEPKQEIAELPEIQSNVAETVEKMRASKQAQIQPETEPYEITKKAPQPSIPVEEIIEQPLMTFDTVSELQIPILVPIEKYEDEVHKHRPIFRIESYDSADQGMEDIEALIEKANRELALEMERAGFKMSDADDSPEEEEEEGDIKMQIPEQEPEVVDEHAVRPKGPNSKDQNKLRRVERRFERMASETLEKEAAAEGSSTPEVELRREAEFEQMVSQLSTEEVAECQQEYSHLWDEGGLTPSEDWDSRDPDTPSGELEEESTTASPPGTSV